MALANEMIGSSFLHKSSFVSQSKLFQSVSFEKQFRPIWVVPAEKRKVVHLRKAVNGPVAAISEDLDLVKAVPLAEKPVKFKVRAVVTIRNKNKEDMKETIVKHLDAFTDRIGQNVVLQLISTEIDPKTNAPKKSNEAVLKDWSKKTNVKVERVNYIAEFLLTSDFGEPGAITITNKHQQEFFLETITIEQFASDPIHFPCNSWVQSRKNHPAKRIFFSNKAWAEAQGACEAPRLKEAMTLVDVREARAPHASRAY